MTVAAADARASAVSLNVDKMTLRIPVTIRTVTISMTGKTSDMNMARCAGCSGIMNMISLIIVPVIIGHCMAGFTNPIIKRISVDKGVTTSIGGKCKTPHPAVGRLYLFLDEMDVTTFLFVRIVANCAA